MKNTLLIGIAVLAVVLAGCNKTEVTGDAVVDLEQCTDTDKGNDITQKGAVNGEFTDRCVAGILIEYYCEDKKPVNQNYKCQNKCVDGACA